jgi:AcrR family transcriptional regulator
MMVMAREAKAGRPRGRPPRSDGQVTAARLLDAAAAVCAERGFDGSTLAEIAARADLTPTAIYNHYGSREDLLYAAAVRGLEQITTIALDVATGYAPASAVAAAYLRPETRQTRRLIAELHLASARDERLAELLATWHRTWTDIVLAGLPADDPAPRATAKALFLILLGLCHVDDLPAVRAPQAAVAERIQAVVAQLIPGPAEPEA